MIYKTFKEWKDGNWLEDGEPRKEAYTKDELLLVEMGWKYGFDAGKAQIKELSDEENNLKWWISSFEHLKALGGGISDEMETKLKEMKARLKKASEK